MTRARTVLLMLPMVACLTPMSLAEEFPARRDRDSMRRRLLIEPRRKRLPADIPTDAHRAWYDRVGAEARGQTWLGVQLGPVPAALTAHLQSDRGSVMIRNVYRDSPADEAGLQRYDVIVKADGEPIDSGIAGFSKYVRDKEPGDTLELTIYHAGKAKSLEIELKRRPGVWGELELKYEDDPDVADLKRFGLRGKIFRFGPDGWKLEDLGEIPELRDLYHYYLHPGIDPDFDEGDVDEVRRVDKEGRSLHVRRNKDGTIVVERSTSQKDKQEAEVTTYKSMSDLKQGDPEAYELLQSARRKPRMSDQAKEAARKYREALRHYEEALREYADTMRKHQGPRRWPTPGGEDKWREWSERFFQGPLKDLKDPRGFIPFVVPGPEGEVI